MGKSTLVRLELDGVTRNNLLGRATLSDLRWVRDHYLSRWDYSVLAAVTREGGDTEIWVPNTLEDFYEVLGKLGRKLRYFFVNSISFRSLLSSAVKEFLYLAPRKPGGLLFGMSDFL
jgi:hypothetical protein